MSPNTLSAAASPRCKLAMTVANCRIGRRSSIVAAMKLTKLPTVNVPAAARYAVMVMTAPMATATTTWTMALGQAPARASLKLRSRTALAASANRRRS